ncbi:MAG: hypothetical protein EXX96DRAFT_647037 [Benjaminiella poitrasii]|nr:MAG: hypothetical protein EXX96DRAFT_647037 [Benjaminiella poitrasii]
MHDITQTIISGDFNAQMGAFTGDHDRNSQGILMELWGSSIVVFFLTTNGHYALSLTIDENFSFDSDHKMMDLDFQLYAPPNSILENRPLLWYLCKLHKSSIQECYVATFQQGCVRQLYYLIKVDK